MIRVLPGLLARAGAASARMIGACHDCRTSAFAVAEPWEANTRLFANSAVRQTGGLAEAVLRVTPNQSTGLVTARLD